MSCTVSSILLLTRHLHMTFCAFNAFIRLAMKLQKNYHQYLRLTLSSHDRVALCVTAWMSCVCSIACLWDCNTCAVSVSVIFWCERPPVVSCLQWQASNEDLPRSGRGGTSQHDHGTTAAHGADGSRRVSPSSRHTTCFFFSQCILSDHTTNAVCLNKPEVVNLFAWSSL